MLSLKLKEILMMKYNVNRIEGLITETRIHRKKEIRHHRYSLIFEDGTSLDISVPHYFESVGTERRFIKELKKDILKKRNVKIQKIKEKLCGGVL